MSKARLVTGFLKSRVAEEAVVDSLIKQGYTRNDISVLMSDATRSKEFAVETKNRATDGAGVGGALGAIIGAVILAVLATNATITIPAIGSSVTGPVVAVFAGAGVGSVIGGILGFLIGFGFSEYRARVYDAAAHGGGILIGVEAQTNEEANKLKRLLQDLGAEYVKQK